MERVNFEESSKNREYIRVSEEFKQRVTKDDGSDFERVSRRVTLDEVKENIVLEKKKTIWQDPYVRLSIILTIVSIIYSIIGLISARKIKDIKNLSFEDMELWLMLGLTSLICVCAIFLTCYFYYKKRTLINSYNLNLKKAYKRFYFISIILQVGLYLGFMIPNIILIKDPFNIIAVYLCSFILFFSIIIYLVSAPFDGKR